MPFARAAVLDLSSIVTNELEIWTSALVAGTLDKAKQDQHRLRGHMGSMVLKSKGMQNNSKVVYLHENTFILERRRRQQDYNVLFRTASTLRESA